MSTFERYLTVWVALCIIVGIACGHFFPSVFHTIGSIEVAKVNLPVAVLIWLMIIPMLVKIDFAALSRVKEHWRGIGVTLFINWAVKPFSMALLGWIFIGWLFKSYLPVDQINSYVAGLILLAAAPCTAMVFVWSNLSDGEPHFTLSQVALNDVIMVFAFAPIVGLLLGISAITVPWETLLLSVVLYIVVPVIIAQVIRRSMIAGGGSGALARLLSALQPISLAALLATLVLLFGFQGEQILSQPLIIAILAVPILIQVYFNAGLAYILNRAAGEAHCVDRNEGKVRFSSAASCCRGARNCVLLAAVVGSGIMAQKLAGGNDALALLCNTLPTGAISRRSDPRYLVRFREHISIRRSESHSPLRRELPRQEMAAYIVAQIVGGMIGVWTAHLMFELPVWQMSRTCERAQANGSLNLSRPLDCC